MISGSSRGYTSFLGHSPASTQTLNGQMVVKMQARALLLLDRQPHIPPNTSHAGPRPYYLMIELPFGDANRKLLSRKECGNLAGCGLSSPWMSRASPKPRWTSASIEPVITKDAQRTCSQKDSSRQCSTPAIAVVTELHLQGCYLLAGQRDTWEVGAFELLAL